MDDRDYLRCVNTILAVYRIDIVITTTDELVPTLWVVLLELYFQKFIAKQIPIMHKELSPDVSDEERIQWVVEGLELLAGFKLEHLDINGIAKLDMKSIRPLIELFWELFKALDDTSQSESAPKDNSIADTQSSTEMEKVINVEKSIQTQDEEIQEETTHSIDTSQTTSKRKKLSPLNLSAEEMREYELEPIKNEAIGNRGEDRSKKRLRFRPASPQKRDIFTAKQKSLDIVENLLKTHKDAYNWKPKDLEWLKKLEKQIESDHDQSEDRDWADVEAYLSTILEPDYYPETRAEENLDKLFTQFSEVVPLIRPFPPSEKEKAWKNQLLLSKRALEDRLWNQKVMIQKSKPVDITPVDIFLENTKKTLKESQRNEARSFNRLKSALRDRYRKIKLLEHQYRKLKDETKRQLQKQEYLEAQLSAGIVKEYMKAQRKAIIEERRAERDHQREALRIAQTQEENMQNQLLKEIAMIKEEIFKAEEEAKIVKKAEREAVRSLRRDTKGIQQSRIRSLKTNIASEIESDNYRKETVNDIDIRFDLTKKKA